MGRYVNPGNRNYARAVNSGIYVDKTGMLSHLNQVMDTEQCWVCVSRPRRFGKTLAADMAAAYYSRGCNSDALFRGKAIRAVPPMGSISINATSSSGIWRRPFRCTAVHSKHWTD